jgi:hypothetical protein
LWLRGEVLSTDAIGVFAKGREVIPSFFFKLPQNRHPERSASQIDRRDTEIQGAESKDPEDAYFVDAVRSFSPTQAQSVRRFAQSL